MLISGLVKSGLIDYPGKVAAVVFTQGCNFRCGFCHNPDLVPPKDERGNNIDEAEVLAFLEKRRGLLDGVVVTGGEPLVQKDAIDFIRKVKQMGYLVKLDSNGANPAALKRIIDEGLVDYIAMDVKGTPGRYQEICGYSNTKFIQESIEIIKNSGIKYEFRTTVLPRYHNPTDFLEIGKMIKGADCYTVQGFRPKITLDKALGSERSFTRDELEEIRSICEPFVKKVVIHDNI